MINPCCIHEEPRLLPFFKDSQRPRLFRFFRAASSLNIRGVLMFCEEQDRLSRDITSAVEEHAQLMERIVRIIRSREPRDGFRSLVCRAAVFKAKWETA